MHSSGKPSTHPPISLVSFCLTYCYPSSYLGDTTQGGSCEFGAVADVQCLQVRASSSQQLHTRVSQLWHIHTYFVLLHVYIKTMILQTVRCSTNTGPKKKEVHSLGFVVRWLCTCIQVIDPEFDPGHKSVLSFSFGQC